jgi:hypothetical protein
MTAELNIKIASAKRGKGYAKKALIQFLDYFFNQLGGRVMLDDVALDNEEGQKLLLRFGFEHDPGMDDVFRLFMTRERYHRLQRSRDSEYTQRANTEAMGRDSLRFSGSFQNLGRIPFPSLIHTRPAAANVSR